MAEAAPVLEEVPLTRDPLFDKEKFVFAVDLVLYVLDEEWPLAGRMSRDINDYFDVRDRVYHNFTEVARQAVDNLRETQREDVRSDYNMLVENGALDPVGFKRCVDMYIENNFFGQVFNARSLFRFAVSIALLAGHLCNHPDGVQIDNPAELAINAIINAFPHPDIDYELRNSLHRAAERYARDGNESP